MCLENRKMSLFWAKYGLLHIFPLQQSIPVANCSAPIPPSIRSAAIGIRTDRAMSQRKLYWKTVCSENTFCYAVLWPRKPGVSLPAFQTVEIRVGDGGDRHRVDCVDPVRGGGETLSRRPVTKTAMPFPRRMGIG